jgi:hypothetical protein
LLPAALAVAGYASKTRTALLVIETVVDLCNLGNPTLAFRMLQRQNLLVRPVKVIRNVRYLLIEPL